MTLATVAARRMWVVVCTLDELPLGLGRAIEVGGHPVAVFRTRSGTVFAVDDRCPHRGGPLSEGMLAGDQVVCPMHSFRFDSRTGDCDQPNVCRVATHPVEVIDGIVRVAVPVVGEGG